MGMSWSGRPSFGVEVDAPDERVSRRGNAEEPIEMSDRDDVAAIHLATPRHLASHDQRGQLVGVHVRQPGRLHQGVPSFGCAHDANASFSVAFATVKSK